MYYVYILYYIYTRKALVGSRDVGYRRLDISRDGNKRGETMRHECVRLTRGRVGVYNILCSLRNPESPLQSTGRVFAPESQSVSRLYTK